MNAFQAGSAAASQGDSRRTAATIVSPSTLLGTTPTSTTTTSLHSTTSPSTPIPATPLAPTTSPPSASGITNGASTLGRLGAGSSGAHDTATPPSTLNSTPVSPRSPVRFVATTDAFGLHHHHHHHQHSPVTTAAAPASPTSSTSPNSATPGRRLRRPSLLSLAPSTSTQPIDPISRPETIPEPAEASFDGDDAEMSTLPKETVHPHPQPAQRWGVSPLSPLTSISGTLAGGTPSRVGSAPPISFEGLTTRASPVLSRRNSIMGEAPEPETLSWASELQRRRASAASGRVADGEEFPAARLPFSGRPLPGPLLATLISESSPLEHEMRSEARYQRLISSHPSVFPLTPRQRRNTRWTRGRFPEMVGDDDDDDEDVRQLGSRWLAGSSDTDSDDMMDDGAPEWPTSMSSAAGAVNSAFASVMDLDRPASSGSSGAWASASGKSTPGGGRSGVSASLSGASASASGSTSAPTAQAAPTPPSTWKNAARVIAPSPGTGLQLPTAFGGLAMGSHAPGSATPLGSPTVEKLDLAASPNMAPSTPGMMQYREPTSGRPGKRKAGDDRFDPYKRPRGSSPSPFQNAALSPSKPTAIPIPSSPSHLPLVGSALALGSPGYLSLGGGSSHAHGHSRKPTHTHPYTRPMAARSRAASPALSIGSTSGVLSTSLGNGGLHGPSRPLAGPFIPTGPGAAAAAAAANAPGAAPGSLGSLGLLSLGSLGAAPHSGSATPDGEAMEED